MVSKDAKYNKSHAWDYMFTHEDTGYTPLHWLAFHNDFYSFKFFQDYIDDFKIEGVSEKEL